MLDKEPPLLARLLRHVAATGHAVLQRLRRRLVTATKPAAPALVAENALLRQQLLVLRRSVKRPRCTPTDRALLVLLAGQVRGWRSALLLVQPDTLLRWHQQLFRHVWRRKSQAVSPTRGPKVSFCNAPPMSSQSESMLALRAPS